MSSPLEGRIRALAREEVASLLGVATPADSAGTDPDQLASLDKKVTELSALVKQFGARLDAVEKAAGKTGQEAPASTRRTRKTAE